MPIILYIAAALAWVILLWPYPFTVFMAGCLSCVTFPLFQALQRRFTGFKALGIYIAGLCMGIILPLSILALLVAPQAAAGLNTLQKMREANFKLPPSWQDYLLDLKIRLSTIPGVGKVLQDLQENFDTMLSKTIGTIVSGGFGIVGSTFTALWLIFLFVTLTVLCTVYAAQLRSVSLVIFRLPAAMFDRFVLSIRGALRGVILGIVLVALAQGFLCGIAFAAAGIKQPAFWGLLATFVAPIPIVGTALVWVPLCLTLWFTGSTFAAVGLALWGTLAVAGVDNILRPLFLRQGINAPLFVLVLSILCGMASFGPVGLIVGPVLVAFALQAVKEGETLLAHKLDS